MVAIKVKPNKTNLIFILRLLWVNTSIIYKNIGRFLVFLFSLFFLTIANLPAMIVDMFLSNL